MVYREKLCLTCRFTVSKYLVNKRKYIYKMTVTFSQKCHLEQLMKTINEQQYTVWRQVKRIKQLFIAFVCFLFQALWVFSPIVLQNLSSVIFLMNFMRVYVIVLAAPTGYGSWRACAGQEYSRKCLHSATWVQRPSVLFTSGTLHVLSIKTSSCEGLHRPYAIIAVASDYRCPHGGCLALSPCSCEDGNTVRQGQTDGMC